MAHAIHSIFGIIAFGAFVGGFYFAAVSFQQIRETLPKIFQDELSARYATDAYAFEHNVPRETQRRYVISEFLMATATLATSIASFDLPDQRLWVGSLGLGLLGLLSSLKNLRRYVRAGKRIR